MTPPAKPFGISCQIFQVGTHAVGKGSKSTLRQRLKAHLGTRAGGGNHRGSIFRLHVGAALLAREGVRLRTWGMGSSAPETLRNSARARAKETAWEQRVSAHIGAMPVLWVRVPGAAGPSSRRAFIECNAIALLSNNFVPADRASAGWLGRHSPRPEIRSSGLWNLNHVTEAYDAGFLDAFESFVELARKSYQISPAGTDGKRPKA